MTPPPDARLIAAMITLPAAPQNLRLFHSELSGVITVSFKPERRSSSNEAQVNLGDPNDEAGWVQKPLIRGGKAELTGLAPGIVVWVRVRTIGLKGVMGVWNGPAQIRTARCEGGAGFLVWGEPLARPGATEQVAPREQLTTPNSNSPLLKKSFCPPFFCRFPHSTSASGLAGDLGGGAVTLPRNRQSTRLSPLVSDSRKRGLD
jgi:hypothetical protein